MTRQEAYQFLLKDSYRDGFYIVSAPYSSDVYIGVLKSYQVYKNQHQLLETVPFQGEQFPSCKMKDANNCLCSDSEVNLPDGSCSLPQEPNKCEADSWQGILYFPSGTPPIASACRDGCSYNLWDGTYICEDGQCYGHYKPSNIECDGSGDGGGSPDPDPNPDPDGGGDGGGDGSPDPDPNPDPNGGGDGGGDGDGGVTNPDPDAPVCDTNNPNYPFCLDPDWVCDPTVNQCDGGGGGGDGGGGGGGGDSGSGDGDGQCDPTQEDCGLGGGGSGVTKPGEPDDPWKDVLNDEDIQKLKDKTEQVKTDINKQMNTFKSLFSVPDYGVGGNIAPVEFDLNHNGTNIPVKFGIFGNIAVDISSIVLLCAAVIAFLIVTTRN